MSGSASNQLRRQMSCSEETNSSCSGNKILTSGNTSNVEVTKANQLVSSSSSSSSTLNKTLYGPSRANKVQLSSTDPHSVLSAEAVEVLDKMREGADLLRNNTNSFLSGELLPSSLLVGTGQQPPSATSIGNSIFDIPVAVTVKFTAFYNLTLCSLMGKKRADFLPALKTGTPYSFEMFLASLLIGSKTL